MNFILGFIKLLRPLNIAVAASAVLVSAYILGVYEQYYILTCVVIVVIAYNGAANAFNDYCDYEIDLFSIDIDGIDYWIIKKLKNNISKIFVAEYNPVFGSDLEITVPNILGFERTKYHYSNLCYGMSLKALINLMNQKGYYFIGTNIQKNNAFFILKNFTKEYFFNNIKIKNLDNYTNSNIRDSRDKNNNLSYLSGDKKLKEIVNCEVINLKDGKEQLVKLKELL